MKDKPEIIEQLEIGTFLKDASGRFTYELDDFPIENYKGIKKDLRRKFGLIPFGFAINGFDAVFQTYIKGLKRIGIEWDVWSGLIIVAKNKKAEPLVKEIGHYLENNNQI